MREILFRAKAINRDKGEFKTNYKNGDWVYGLLTREYDPRFERLPAEFRNEYGVSGIEVDHTTIGQFTGLTDKNGAKIFEGDIFAHPDKPKCKYVVEFISEYGSAYVSPFDTDGCGFDARTVEIIGNIHDGGAPK